MEDVEKKFTEWQRMGEPVRVDGLTADAIIRVFLLASGANVPFKYIQGDFEDTCEIDEVLFVSNIFKSDDGESKATIREFIEQTGLMNTLGVCRKILIDK